MDNDDECLQRALIRSCRIPLTRDMFQTSLGKPSHMHAAARAISGGPVYVSDRPEEHDRIVLNKLAFANGMVPRCIRNALPLQSMLFRDPQREAGVPLVLQNLNPCGGFVVGVFSIAGSVLEDDKHSFRFLSPTEMIWPPQFKVSVVAFLMQCNTSDLSIPTQSHRVL
jgi:Raffinose synthase or seed imbibition protein Sip1